MSRGSLSLARNQERLTAVPPGSMRGSPSARSVPGANGVSYLCYLRCGSGVWPDLLQTDEPLVPPKWRALAAPLRLTLRTTSSERLFLPGMSDGMDGRCSRLALRAASTTGGAFLSPTAPQKLLPKPQTPLPLSLKPTADLAAQGRQRIVLLRQSKRNSPSSPLSRPRPLLLDEHLACFARAGNIPTQQPTSGDPGGWLPNRNGPGAFPAGEHPQPLRRTSSAISWCFTGCPVARRASRRPALA